MVGASLVLSVSAWYLLKHRHLEFARRNLTLALWFFAVLSVLQAAVFGAQMAITVTNYQQVKLAAMEGVWESRAVHPDVPRGLGERGGADHHRDQHPLPAQHPGLPEPPGGGDRPARLPSSDWAPVNLTFQVYHLMIDLGGLFPLIGLVGVVALACGSAAVLYALRPLLWVFVVTIVLTEVATIAGWWTGEVGRQPWIVWNLLRTADAVSPVLAHERGPALPGDVRAAVRAALLPLPVPPQPQDPGGTRSGLEAEELPEALPDTFREVFRGQPRASYSPRGPVPGIRVRREDVGDVWLNNVWFVLFVAIVAGYLIMDGFDLGVGILHLFVAESDAERRVLAEQHRPGLGRQRRLAGGLGGAPCSPSFPIVYAALFSGFYGAMMLVLLALILRAGRDRVPQQASRGRAGGRCGTASSPAPRWGWPCCWASPSATSWPACRSKPRARW